MGQAQAPGQKELVSINSELAGTAEHIAPLATFTVIDSEDASVAKVTQALRKTKHVHFACYGISNQKRPFESSFALHDRYLKIEDIMRYNLQQAQFAYLSACRTTVRDEGSPDDPATAMHFAGFRFVVGTMWGVDDGVTNEVTSMFYVYLVDESSRLGYMRATCTLNRTMWLSAQTSLNQRIMFVHIGA